MSSINIFEKISGAIAPVRARKLTLDTHQSLFLQSDKPVGLPLVVDGEISLMRWTDSARQVRIHTARRGEIFAEGSLFSDVCHCDAIATMPSVIQLLPPEPIRKAFANNTQLAMEFAEHLAHSLMKARQLLELRAITPLSLRVLTRLRTLVDANGELPAGFRLQTIAHELDVTPTALYRTLARLEAEGELRRPARGRIQLVTTDKSAKPP